MSVRTITAKQMRNAYEYMVSHARTQINLERLSDLIETADVWDQNGRRDCFVTGDLSVEVKKVPDKDMRGLFHAAKMREALLETKSVIAKCMDILNKIPDGCEYDGLIDEVADELCDLRESHVNAALAAPPRNCDRPECATTKEAQDVWRKEDGGKTAYYEWLLAISTKGGAK